MKQSLIKSVVRARLQWMSLDRAAAFTRRMLHEYLGIAQGLDDTAGSAPVRVQKMLGVDEDMRDWSFYMLLRHTTIVNERISDVVARLAKGEPDPVLAFDVKRDVMPNSEVGADQVSHFTDSLLGH